MSIFLIILSSIWLGININSFYTGLRNRISEKKKFNDKNKQFSEILSNVVSVPTKAKFKSRVNNTIYITTRLEEKGEVDLIYLMDKNDVAIFKNDECIYTSENVNSETLNKIMESVGHVFSNEINDVVNILGFTFDRPEFEKSFGIKMDDVKKMMNSISNSITQEDSEIDKIYHDNQMRFDIDEILDRINIVGIKNLTKAELDFLRKYSKK
jgi:hypothetical protein